MKTGIGACVMALTLSLAACAPPSQPTASAPSSKPAATAAPVQAVTPAASPVAKSESLDELYEKAKREGGTLSLYGTLNPNTTKVVFSAFEKRFPGIKVDWVDGTSERLVARIIAESRGGKVLADVLQSNIDGVSRLIEQRLLTDLAVPEAADYPAGVKGAQWLASDLKFYIMAWNTNMVKKEEAPKQFEDLTDPRWRNRIIADPADVELLVALTKKYQSEEKAIEVLRRLAANNIEFHSGHSELAELLVAGQGSVCLTCFSHHFPPRIKRGAPVDYLLSEGVGLISANGVLKDAPHPNTALLWVRWVATEEGQRAYAEAGATPAHPRIEPTEKTRPEKIYPVTAEDLKEYPRYEKTWREIFQIR